MLVFEACGQLCSGPVYEMRSVLVILDVAVQRREVSA